MTDRAALTGIIFVLKSGIPWEMSPQKMGWRSGSTCWRRLRDWEEAGVWEKLHRVLLDRLGKADEIDWSRASLDSASVPAKGGERTGKNPTDRGKPGSKRHLVSDKNGVPLAVVLTAANIHDSTVFEETVDAIEPIKDPGGGRPRKRPEKLHSDKGYDAKNCCKALRKRRIKSRIARKGVESSERLGRYRWSNRHWRGWAATGDWRCATRGEPTSTKRSFTSAAHSSASTIYREGCARRTKEERSQ